MAINRTKLQRKRAFKSLSFRLLALVVFGIVLLASLWLYNYLTSSSRLAIREIRVIGMNRASAEEVERLLADLKGENIFLVPLESYRRRIEALNRVKEASLRRVLPSRLVCSIREREPIALVFCGRFLEVDGEGMVMPEDELSPLLDLPIITGLPGTVLREGRVCRDKGLRGALEALRICKSFGGEFVENISEIRIGRGGVSLVSLRGGYVVVLGHSDFENRLKKFFVFRNAASDGGEAARYIDLRFEDQIVLRNSF